MPQVKSVKSLAEISIRLIVENQEFFCERFTPGEPEDGVNALDCNKPAINPFEELPTELLEELMKHLRKKETSIEKFYDRHLYPYGFGDAYKITAFLKLLITRRLRTLDLTLIEKGSCDISDVLYLATLRSPNLETLRLDYTTRPTYFNLIPKFMKLRILAIPLPETGDECFELIGNHCPDLREFFCSPHRFKYIVEGRNRVTYDESNQVTDDGIRKLCVDGNCKSIRILSLRGCRKVTTKGIQMALDNLPQLRILRHEYLLKCLSEIAQSAIDQKLNLPKYSLTTLSILEDTLYKIGYLRKSVLLCPNVTRVYLSMLWKERFEGEGTEFLSLLSLEKLYTIEITFAAFEDPPSAGREIQIDRLTFDSVIPLLMKFGWCLKKLNFDGFSYVDIPAIINYCPNLESLSITNCKTNQSTTQTTVMESPIILQKLKQLNIRKFGTISSENLFALLSSPSLSYIYLGECDNLTDNILQSAANLHSFRNLEFLILCSYNSVTKKGIDIFLKESNPLRTIVLHYIGGITREDINDWKDNAIWTKKNWQFKLYIITCCRKICLGGNRDIWEGEL